MSARNQDRYPEVQPLAKSEKNLMRPLILGVPFYKNARLVEPLARSILQLNIDKTKCDLTLVFVIDSPSDLELVKALDDACGAIRSVFPVDIITNETNLGFVASANAIIARAKERAADVILVNSDVVLFGDTVREMLEVAELDPMVGFVSPRTNDTTICTFPLPPSNDDPVRLYENFCTLARRLPRMTYVPTAVGFCLLIKSKILQDFAGFDHIFGPGYNEENDLIMRANRCGYGAVIANWAFAYHERGSSFALAARGRSELEKRNSAILGERHPYYYSSVQRYFQSSEHEALVLVSRLGETERRTVAFDFSNYGTHKNGTTEYGTKVLRSFIRQFGNRYKVYAVCHQPVWLFHDLDKIDGLSWSPVDSDERYAAMVRLSQPFDVRSLAQASSRAAVVIFSMLDTIAYDCLYLRDSKLHRLWQFVMQFSDAVIYISAFSKNQFVQRFATCAQVQHAVCMPSTDIDEYRSAYSESTPPGDYLLVIGNHYAHKAIRETVHLIRERLPLEQLRVLGIKLTELPNLVSFESGTLHDSATWELYSKAKAVVFPSHYEGFGFPVLHALGNRKVVFVRELPVYAEIKARIAGSDNIRVFRTNEELVAQLADGDFEWRTTARKVSDVGWDRTASETEAVLAHALRSTTMETVKRRLENLDLLKEALNSAELAANAEQARHLLETTLAEERRGFAMLREEVKSIRNSTSWRITAPLRSLKARISRNSN